MTVSSEIVQQLQHAVEACQTATAAMSGRLDVRFLKLESKFSGLKLAQSCNADAIAIIVQDQVQLDRQVDSFAQAMSTLSQLKMEIVDLQGEVLNMSRPPEDELQAGENSAVMTLEAELSQVQVRTAIMTAILPQLSINIITESVIL